MFENFPYVNFHDLNLDWIISEIKKCYSPDNPPDMAVISVNGDTGAVVLYTDAIVRLPDVTDDTWNIHRIADGSSEGIQFKKNNPAVRINGTNRYPIYDQGNPPPYPVTSVDGQTGNVNTWGHVGGQNMTFPVEADGEVWALRRDTPAGYLGIQFELDESDDPCGFFILKPEDQTLQKIKILTESDIPSEAGVVSINGEAGVVVLYAGDIKMASDDNTTIKGAIEGTQGLIVSDYNSSNSYSAGDFCLYLGTMYVCTGTTTGSWNPAKWTATSVAAELKSVKAKQATDESNISTLQGDMTTAQAKIGQNQAIVAYPENDSTSSTNYSVGQYIARNGSLYKVIANISAGDQFTGSNISAVDNLGHEVSALNSDITSSFYEELTTTSEVSGGKLKCVRKLNIVNIEFDGITFSSAGNHTIAYLPAYAHDGRGSTFIAMAGTNPRLAAITQGGTLSIYGAEANVPYYGDIVIIK